MPAPCSTGVIDRSSALPVSSTPPDDSEAPEPFDEELFRSTYGEHPAVSPEDSEWVELLDQVLEKDPFDLRARSEAVRHERKLALHPDRLFESACSLLVYWQSSALPKSAAGLDPEDTGALATQALDHAIPRLLQDDERAHRIGQRPDEVDQHGYEELVGALPVPDGAERDFLVRFNRTPYKRRAFLYPFLFQGQSLAERARETGNTVEAVQKKFMKQLTPLLDGLEGRQGGWS